MQIEDNQNDDFHRTDLEGGDEPAEDEMMATPEEEMMMPPPEEEMMMEATKDDDYMGEEMMGMGTYEDSQSESTREAIFSNYLKTRLEECYIYRNVDLV